MEEIAKKEPVGKRGGSKGPYEIKNRKGRAGNGTFKKINPPR